MKKSISFLLCLVLIFSSFSFCFASPTSWDTSDQANLQGILRAVTSYGSSNLYYYVSQIYSLTNTISNNVNTIKGYLVDGGYSVAYWIHSISTWMNPIYNALVSTPLDLNTIIGALGYYNDSTFYPYLNYLYSALTNSGDTSNGYRNWAHNKAVNSSGVYSLSSINGLGELSFTNYNWSDGTPIGNLFIALRNINENFISNGRILVNYLFSDIRQPYSYTRYTDLGTSSFTPNTLSGLLATYLDNIQTPVARLSYVLASEERIEAQELAADNEQAVVDNFIDSSGSGAASTSDFDSIADFSSGYKTTFSSDASPTGLFNLFTSDNMSWFSQETANQLDTTSNNRAKSDNTFNTPLLDQQINSIYEQLGVKKP